MSYVRKSFWAIALIGIACFAGFAVMRSVLNDHHEATVAGEREGSDTDSPWDAFLWRRLQWLDEHGEIAPGSLQRAIAQKEAILASSPHSRVLGDYWTERGPDNTSGRNRAIVINPTNTSIMYQAAAGGGVWKSTDGGVTWNPISDEFASLAMGALAMDPNNPNVIYAGTGEGYYNGDALDGVGIYKTTDGGNTWTLLSGTTSFGNTNKVVISPSNSNLILAATQYGGIQRSTDAGATWTNVHGAQAGQSIAFSSANPSNVIAGVLDYDFTANEWYNQLAYSTDGGVTWTRSASSRVNQFGDYEVTFAGGSSTLCYASGPSSSSDSTVTCYKSTDGGQTWASAGSFSGSGQNWYDNAIFVDPTNSNLIVIGDTYVWRSTNGGTSFTKINGNGYLQTTMPHPDCHAIVPDPGYNGSSNRIIYFCTDGGSYKAADITTVRGNSNTGWSRLDLNCHTTQYYYIAGDGGSGHIMGGLQDNGTLMLQNGSNNSVYTYGGDGGDAAIDPTNSNYVFGEYVDLELFRATNGGTTQNSGSSIYSGISDAGSNANFISPFVLDPNAPTTLLAGGASLWRTTNDRAGTVSWSSIKSQSSTGQPISAIAVAPGNSNIVWVAYNDGQVAMTTNGTAASPNWTVIDDNSSHNPLPNRYPTEIVIDPASSNTVYITFGGFSSDNVWKTTNAGSTWASITGNLPQAPVHCIARNPLNANILYVGTEVGLFSSSNGGASWTVSSDMVTNSPVDDLKYMNNSNTLIAGTHGRGVWVLGAQSVSGHVALGNYSGDVTVPTFVMDILDSGNNIVQTFNNVQLDSSGNFSIDTAVAPGTYSVRIKGTTRFLRKRISNVAFTVAGASGLTATLTNGDINGDNTVSLADFGALKLAYGSSSGSSNWNPSADLDGNGSVGLSDFGILKLNYGKSGDN